MMMTLKNTALQLMFTVGPFACVHQDVAVDVKLMYGRRLLRQLFFIQNMTQVRLRARMHCTEIRVQTEYLVKEVSGISIHHSRGATPGHTDNQRDIGIQSSE